MPRNQSKMKVFKIRLMTIVLLSATHSHAAWITPSSVDICKSNRMTKIVLHSHPSNGMEKKSIDSENDKSLNEKDSNKGFAEYGISYIGGDPCGSKYNDDPFDAAKSKPQTSVQRPYYYVYIFRNLFQHFVNSSSQVQSQVHL